MDKFSRYSRSLVPRFELGTSEKKSLSGSLVTMAWGLLILRMEDTVSRYGG